MNEPERTPTTDWPLVCLIAFFLAADLAAWRIRVADQLAGQFVNRETVINLSLFFSQINLAAAWAALSSRNSVLRMLALAGVAYLARYLLLTVDDANSGKWLLFVMFESSFVAVPLLVCRGLGLRLTKSGVGEALHRDQFQPWQFGLRGALGSVGGFALVMAAPAHDRALGVDWLHTASISINHFD